MALISINKNPSTRELKWFAGLLFPLFWLIVGWFVGRLAGSLTAMFVIWLTAVAVSIACWLNAGLAGRIYLAWMWAAYPIGWVVGHLLLAATYYLVVTPIGLALRAFGRDAMQRTIDRNAATYWQPHQPRDDPADYFRQY